MRFHHQHTRVWCWAAAAATAIEYARGAATEDCEVLSQYDFALGGPGGCCAQPQRCMRRGLPGEIETILGNVYDLRGRSQSYAPSLRELAAQIDRGVLLIAWLWNSPRTAHIVAISGYDGPRGRVLVLDPLQPSPVWVNYAWLRENDLTGVWRDTIFVDGPPRDRVALAPVHGQAVTRPN